MSAAEHVRTKKTKKRPQKREENKDVSHHYFYLRCVFMPNCGDWCATQLLHRYKAGRVCVCVCVCFTLVSLYGLITPTLGKDFINTCHLLYNLVTNAEARFNKSHIRKVYACLAVTCHLHFWQNDRDFLRATAVTRGWNGYRNKSQHRKSTLEKKILPPFQQGFEPATFQSRARRSNH